MNDDPNIFTQEGNPQPYAKRTVSSIFNIGIILLILGVGMGWYLTSGDNDQRTAAPQNTVMTVSDAQSVPQFTNENGSGQGRPRGAVYDFFSQIFSSFLDTRNDQNNMNLNGNIAPASSASLAVDVGQQQLAIAQEMFNGRIVDYEGKPAGDIKAIIQNGDGGRNFVFTLDQSLTPADKPREFQVGYDEVQIIQDARGSYIKLNKEQTEVLAQALFSDDESTNLSGSGSN